MTETQAIDAAVSALEHFPRHPGNNLIAYVPRDFIPHIKTCLDEGLLIAGILKETEEQRRLREDFNATINEDTWDALKNHIAKHRIIHDNLTPDSDAPIPKYILNEERQSYRDLRIAMPNSRVFTSEWLIHSPQSGKLGRYYKWHFEEIPFTRHRTIFGACMEFTTPDDNGKATEIHEIQLGDTVFFGELFHHRSSQHIKDHGQIASASSAIKTGPFPKVL